MNNSGAAILLLAHGTPDRPEDVPAYMRNVTGGRAIPETAMAEVQHRYALIGLSPLTEITQQQATALAKEISLPVYFGMRNWRPYIAHPEIDGQTYFFCQRGGLKRNK